ncbi:MDR/zinc-dependent alcohol dehydrogenase-like family protein [Haliangium sp.]|uniref:MDR/zinc-dependent alcohol dehydrogenase-like family protein n=1 Tax=Haliangium sp. TaxID=2663208 RepID=UPI003D131381
MQALWLEDQALRLRDDVPVPTPPAGEALVRVVRAGVCATDLELVRGYYPYAGVPGHEFVGVVEDGPARLRGQRVVGEINATCTTGAPSASACAACRRGHTSHCERRTTLGIRGRHGAFAEYLSLPAENLHIVPDSVSTDAATFVEPLAAALEIQEQVTVRPGDRALVVGAGKLGQLIAQTLALTGCALATVARTPARHAQLAALGVAAVEPEQVADGSFDLAVDCTGHPDGFALARRALRARGTLVLKSTYAGRLELDASSLVVDEITVVGSRCGPFAPALRLLAAGRVAVEPLLEARYGLADAIAAFAHAGRRGARKVLVDVDARG